jgi:hypothetical protein
MDSYGFRWQLLRVCVERYPPCRERRGAINTEGKKKTFPYDLRAKEYRLEVRGENIQDTLNEGNLAADQPDQIFTVAA